MIMASVCLAAIKIGGVMLGLTPVETVLIALITVIYSSMGGLKGVIITDFFSLFGRGATFGRLITHWPPSNWQFRHVIDPPQCGEQA